MELWKKPVQMGAYVCSICNEVIDTFESEKVITYFIKCNKPNCENEGRVEKHES